MIPDTETLVHIADNPPKPERTLFSCLVYEEGQSSKKKYIP
jgi:hypothetical protein